MAQIRAAASAIIDAPPPVVYGILADYRVGHPGILPGDFQGLEVERGGVGAGTIIRFQVRLLGMTRTVRAEVSEPEPGRVLAETDLETGAVTTFTVKPLDGLQTTLIGITTEWSTPGLKGWVERLTVPRLLRRIYAEELQNLARAAARQR